MHQVIIRRDAAGFTLVEALVALLVVAFGLLATAGVQLTISKGSEAARQRSEATRLAEQKIDELRSFTSIEKAAGQHAWNDIKSGSETTVVGNSSYKVDWTVVGQVADVYDTSSPPKMLTQAHPKIELAVKATWTDRGGKEESLTLSTVLARIDPKTEGALGVPTIGNGTIKRPKNRSLNIPVNAVEIGDNKSAIAVGKWAAVFDNSSGWVIKYCNKTIEQVKSAPDECSNVPAYILTGYLQAPPDKSGKSTTYSSLLAATGVNLSGLTPSISKGSSDCEFADYIDKFTGELVPGFRYYICVVEVGSIGAPYSGVFRFAGSSLNSGLTGYKICRLEYQTALLDSNQRNAMSENSGGGYKDVKMSLDQQNYYITSGSCPADEKGLVKYVVHQDCTTTNTKRAVECPAMPD